MRCPICYEVLLADGSCPDCERTADEVVEIVKEARRLRYEQVSWESLVAASIKDAKRIADLEKTAKTYKRALELANEWFEIGDEDVADCLSAALEEEVSDEH